MPSFAEIKERTDASIDDVMSAFALVKADRDRVADQINARSKPDPVVYPDRYAQFVERVERSKNLIYTDDKKDGVRNEDTVIKILDILRAQGFKIYDRVIKDKTGKRDRKLRIKKIYTIDLNVVTAIDTVRNPKETDGMFIDAAVANIADSGVNILAARSEINMSGMKVTRGVSLNVETVNTIEKLTSGSRNCTAVVEVAIWKEAVRRNAEVNHE